LAVLANGNCSYLSFSILFDTNDFITVPTTKIVPLKKNLQSKTSCKGNESFRSAATSGACLGKDFPQTRATKWSFCFLEIVMQAAEKPKPYDDSPDSVKVENKSFIFWVKTN
jgi:hypothetical protein